MIQAPLRAIELAGILGTSQEAEHDDSTLLNSGAKRDLLDACKRVIHGETSDYNIPPEDLDHVVESARAILNANGEGEPNRRI